MHVDPSVSLESLLSLAAAVFGACWWAAKMTTILGQLQRSIAELGERLERFTTESQDDRRSLHHDIVRMQAGKLWKPGDTPDAH